MISTNKRSLSLLVGAAWAGLSGLPAVADDTELFITDPALQNTSPPNILFVLDTSGSMDTFLKTQPSYDPAVVYPGACDTNRMYWRTGYNAIGGDDNAPPHCTTTNWFYKSSFTCDAAMTALSNGTGYYTDRFAQFDDTDDDSARWLALSGGQKSRYVECEDDAGLHGEATGGGEVYPQNGDDDDPWTSTALDSIGWGQSPADVTYNVYEGNFVNWYYGPLALSKRLGVMQDVMMNLLDQISDVNVGLMRFNRQDGGPVIHAMEDVATARVPMQAKIAGLPADGWTPLSETFYEAGLYYMGRTIDYGSQNDPASTDLAARSLTTPTAYNTPIDLACQKNFVVLLTDGEPSRDTGANSKIAGLPGFSTATGNASCDGTGDGACLDDMAAYLYESDLSPLPGKQNVVTYTIGFTIDLPILKTTAQRGGGGYFLADDTAS
ncbi:MAG: hypothetical protein HKN84_15555, partial [Gammaproteobacteria bacterium]|nr:hypothetical protein [Gammaproteobacteria bacterium]